MPLDHYVSQVHLKNFYSPVLDGLMYGTARSWRHQGDTVIIAPC